MWDVRVQYFEPNTCENIIFTGRWEVRKIYKNISFLIVLLLFGIVYSQKSRIDSLKAIYEAYNVPITKEGRSRDGKTRTYEIKEQISSEEIEI